MISTAKCPNCQKSLDKIPGKTVTCAFCNKKIYVRTTVKGQKVLVDLEGVKQIDDEWIKYALSSKWFKIIRGFGITKKDYMDMHDALTKRWGFNPRHHDIFWGLFNNLLLSLIENGDDKKIKLLKRHMANFQSERATHKI